MFNREEQDACREGQGSFKTRYSRVQTGRARELDVICLTFPQKQFHKGLGSFVPHRPPLTSVCQLLLMLLGDHILYWRFCCVYCMPVSHQLHIHLSTCVQKHSKAGIPRDFAGQPHRDGHSGICTPRCLVQRRVCCMFAIWLRLLSESALPCKH